jgi:hypothetical protein
MEQDGPQREPRPKPQAQPERQRADAHSTERDDQPSAAYTRRPDLGAPPPRGGAGKKALFVVAIAIVAAGIFSRGSRPPAEPASAPVAVAQGEERHAHDGVLVEKKAIALTEKDVDVAATEAARAELEKGNVPEALKAWPEPERQALKEKRSSLYAVHLADSAGGAGNIASVWVKDVPYRDVNLTAGGTVVMVPVRRGEPTLVCLIARKGATGGKVPLRAYDTQGRASARPLSPGEFVAWMVTLK